MSNLRTSLVATALAIASIGAFAQTVSTPRTTPATPRVDQRAANQQARIAQGAGSGQLTPKETHRLEKEQAAINRAEAHAKADGTVTKHERKHLHRMQDSASKDIHRQKHNAPAVPKP